MLAQQRRERVVAEVGMKRKLTKISLNVDEAQLAHDLQKYQDKSLNWELPESRSLKQTKSLWMSG